MTNGRIINTMTDQEREAWQALTGGSHATDRDYHETVRMRPNLSKH
jgi:hypothetical protein